MLKTLVLAQSLRLSNIKPSEYLDERTLGIINRRLNPNKRILNLKYKELAKVGGAYNGKMIFHISYICLVEEHPYQWQGDTVLKNETLPPLVAVTTDNCTKYLRMQHYSYRINCLSLDN